MITGHVCKGALSNFDLPAQIKILGTYYNAQLDALIACSSEDANLCHAGTITGWTITSEINLECTSLGFTST